MRFEELKPKIQGLTYLERAGGELYTEVFLKGRKLP